MNLGKVHIIAFGEKTCFFDILSKQETRTTIRSKTLPKLNLANRGYRFVNPRGGYIKSMRIENGKVVHYESDPMIVEETPPRPVAVAVKNNGEWFNPPTSHLDQPVENQHPVFLAELGLKFYTEYLDTVEKKFFVR